MFRKVSLPPKSVLDEKAARSVRLIRFGEIRSYGGFWLSRPNVRLGSEAEVDLTTPEFRASDLRIKIKRCRNDTRLQKGLLFRKRAMPAGISTTKLQRAVRLG
jgi:hypothetical protein